MRIPAAVIYILLLGVAFAAFANPEFAGWALSSLLVSSALMMLLRGFNPFTGEFVIMRAEVEEDRRDPPGPPRFGI